MVTVKVIEGVFTPEQKQEMIRKITDTMVEIEASRSVPSPGCSWRRLAVATGVTLVTVSPPPMCTRCRDGRRRWRAEVQRQ
jgi:hypothetical protein